MNKLIGALDVARRDNQLTVREWIRVTSIQIRMKNSRLVTFDGDTRGASVYAFVSNGRWQALCDQPNCGGCEYVDPAEPIFYCLTCSNGKSGKARPVKFPTQWEAIESALLERDMIPVMGGDEISTAYNSRPADPSLRRDWIPKELAGHPFLQGRVIAEPGETAEQIRKKTLEVRNAGNL